MELFNIWDLEGVHVRVNRKFLDRINQEIFRKFKIKREAHKNIFGDSELKYSVFKNMLKPSYPENQFLPLDFLIKLCDVLQIERGELQNNIISYRSWGSVNSIDRPKLPIEINPIFDMIYAHNIGDGTVCVSKDRAPYFAYRQFNQFYRESYIKKIEYVFGKINYRKKEFKDVTRVRCPSVLSSLFFKYYHLDDRGFLSDKARISDKIYEKGKKSMIAVLVAFIIDEGHIDSTQITIVLKNKLLIEDLGKVCDLLGYKHSITIKKGDYGKYVGLYILREGMKNFYQDYLQINKEFPLIDLGIKGEKIKNSFKIYDRKIQRTRGNQEAILNSLKNEQLSVNQLADRLSMTRQGIRYHIHNLLNENKIKLISKTKLNLIYGV